MRRYGYQFVAREAMQMFAEEGLLQAQDLPPKVSLRDQCTPVRDQGSLGACTAFALCACLELRGTIVTSPLFLYFRERLLEGDPLQDQGASLASGTQVIKTTGVCLETLWPYIQSKYAASPPPQAYSDASNRQCKKTKALQPGEIKSQLADGVPVVVGILCYASFESVAVQETGVVPMPDTANEPSLGGHAIALVGYDDDAGVFLAKNSWGANWGDGGYLTIPYGYIYDGTLTSEIFAISPLNPSVSPVSPDSPNSPTSPTSPSAPSDPASSSSSNTWSQMSDTQRGLFIAAMVLLGLLLIFMLTMIGLNARSQSYSK